MHKKNYPLSLYDKPPLLQLFKTINNEEVGMRYKMIFGQTLFSFFKKNRHDLLIKEVRFLNKDENGSVRGGTRLMYDEESGTLQRYVNGSAPIASLSDDMVCFLAEVSRCFGSLTGRESWENDVWLCIDTEVIPEQAAIKPIPENESDTPEEINFLPIIAEHGPLYNIGMQ
jgi:hypothetical protein